METLVPEDASRNKDEVEAQDNDEVSTLPLLLLPFFALN